MTDISPTYYAAGEYKLRFTLKGISFDLLPDDVVATPAGHNNNPLDYRYTTDANWYMTIESRSSDEIVFTAARSVTHGPLYLGAILSKDRETIYWENETRPLP